MTRSLAAVAAAILFVLGALPAAAHSQSYGFLTARIDGTTVDGRLDLAVRDLDRLHDLDRDGDGRITWGEVRTREAELAPRLLGHIALGVGDAPCVLKPGAFAVDERGGESYLALPFAGSCPVPGATLTVGYDLMFGVDAQHRGIIDVAVGDTARSAVATPAARVNVLDFAVAGLGAVFADFVAHGAHHIWIGTDHILFVVTLLLSAVVVRRDGRWQPAEHMPAVFWATARVVTAFTVAHSITLALAATGLVALPSALVESVIALSIIVAALNVIWPVVTDRLWLAAFGFGLMHGFGFASVLGELGLPPGRTALALLAFNLGVEIGQLTTVAAVLPVLYLARRSPSYARLALPAGAASIAVIATLWLIERI
ncbi:hypothetical protein C2U72_25920 [Prosthecomicrobium hirschii]|uniref:HupE/UreJ family protein n=1 Tax=Prosthecodimorpha hirschii TaxID=665126 RepID=UPI00112CDA48|nr:HupE/UreJ family protein [Prosthecomicrobium hirschii]TPQ46139.1 hypothetical protein C2U72_25920 [Prosthecomicrobium hirschii]